MSDTSKPVWVWLSGQGTPVVAGEFTLANGVGKFTYAADYIKRANQVSLDPIRLPVGYVVRPHTETLQGGLFGVFRDAKPEGYGLDLLSHMRQVRVDDPMHVLELSEGDAIGALAICDNIEAKLAYVAPKSEDLMDILARLPDTRPSSEAIRQVKGILGTSAGGERPKLTVQHEGQLWLAKLQDRGDQAHAPLREFVSMRVAKQCGVNAADVQFKLVGAREVLLVRRFDRHVDAQGAVTRQPYASAHSVLHLDTHVLRGARTRSYVALSHEMRRWCAKSEGADYIGMQRELWRRIVMNSVLGNGDDHPRNTGLLHDGTQWTLSPAFDIAPYGHGFAGDHSMSISRAIEASSLGSISNMVGACGDYGYTTQEAHAFIDQVRLSAPRLWRAEVAAQGFTDADLPFQEPVWLDKLTTASTSTRARRTRSPK
jgi:serine/threonine-protein kinase HipA